MTLASLELRGVTKTYRGGITAASGVDLAVASGELFVIVGPSGSGKSTLLRLIAGLETLDSGAIQLGGRRIDGLPPRERDLAMVFQDVVVYPHLDVFENIAFGLRARRVDRAEIQARVTSTAASLGLGEILRRSPTTLSGGQKRRVTLARALVLQPKLFLFDEPFSGLDAPLRLAIRGEIADLHRQTGATMILVTHDQAEALALADRIAVVDAGRVVQVGRPLDVYNVPRNQTVARFVGQPAMALIPGTVASGSATSLHLEPAGLATTRWLVARESAAGLVLNDRVGQAVVAGLRAEQVVVPELGVIPLGWVEATATVDRLELLGHETAATLRLGPHLIPARLPAQTSLCIGDVVSMALDLDRACWFDPATGDRVGGSSS